MIFKRLFPNVENILYLSFYERHVKSLNNTSGYLIEYDDNYSPALIEAVRWYDRLYHHLPIEINIKTYLENPKKYSYNESLKSMAVSVKKYIKYFDAYNKLNDQSISFADKIKEMPDAVIFEAYRNQTPKTDSMVIFFEKECNNFRTDQPLLKIRINDVRNLLKEERESLFLFFITEADRIRRARNDIFHNANIPKNFELLVSRLYKYSRIYLREIIYAIAKAPTNIPIEKLLYNRFDWSKTGEKI